MAAERKRTQGEEDVFQAWLYAANCLLYEADGGPDVDVGTVGKTQWVAHAEAVQMRYAQNIVIKLDADLDRLQAAARACHQVATSAQHSRPDFAQENARAADLCERAAHLVIGAGAAGDDRARRRLLAVCEHDTNVVAAIAGGLLAEEAERTLEEAWGEIEAEPDAAVDLPDYLPFQGPSYDETTGRLRIGQASGGRDVLWTLNTPGVGMENGLILGPAGIGKSSTLRIVVVEATLQPKFSLWLADPTNRHGFEGTFGGAADKIAPNTREILAVLREAVHMTDSRLKRGRFPDPSTERRGVLIALEECQEVFADNLEATHLAERIVVDGGPVSVALVATAPDTDLAYYGGSVVLRTGLAKTNAFAMGPNGPYMLKALQLQAE